jgi:hypothetical protein
MLIKRMCHRRRVVYGYWRTISIDASLSPVLFLKWTTMLLQRQISNHKASEIHDHTQLEVKELQNQI